MSDNIRSTIWKKVYTGLDQMPIEKFTSEVRVTVIQEVFSPVARIGPNLMIWVQDALSRDAFP
jgi:hypothetical protein